jgi:hypothetical protein
MIILILRFLTLQVLPISGSADESSGKGDSEAG